MNGVLCQQLRHAWKRLKPPTSGAENPPSIPASTDMMASEDLSANAYELLIQGVVDYAIYLLVDAGPNP